MRILDATGKEIDEAAADLEKGRLVPETINTVFHEAVEAVEEVWHYETSVIYNNGGKEVRRVVDVPGTPRIPEYWDTEEIMRYIPYTEEELAKRAVDASQEELLDALATLLSSKDITTFMKTLVSLGTNLAPTLEKRSAARETLSKGGKKE